MSKDLNIKIGVNLKEVAKLDNIAAKFKETQRATRLTTSEAKKYLGALNQTAKAEGKSINNLKELARGYRQLAQNVDRTSKEYREATREAAKFERQAKSAGGRVGFGGRFRGGRGGIGLGAAAGLAARFAPAAAAITGGGGALGAAFGPVGAALGVAGGAAVSIGAPAAAYAADLKRLRIALQGVTTSQEEFNAGLEIVEQATKDYAIPQEILTKQFTRLQASVQGAGGTLGDTQIAFDGIVAAVRATGGSLTDVDAALTATAQVLSKGKVSAEELRQQIGERLPGAFTLFADSIGLTPQELDKALEKGEVSLEDFQKFAKSLFERYGETAKIIAGGPEAAGDRLRVALKNLQEDVGNLVQPIGAAFQDVFTSIVEAVNNAINAVQDFFDFMRARAQADKEFLTLPMGRGTKRVQQRKETAEQRAARVTELMEQFRAERVGSSQITQPKGFKGGLPGAGDATGGDKERVDISKDMLQLELDLNQAIRDGELVTAARLTFQKDMLRIKESELLPNEKLRDQDKARTKLHKTLLGLLEQEKEETEKIKGVFEQIGDTIKKNIVDGLTEAIVQGKNLQEVLSNVLRTAASLFIRQGLSQLPGLRTSQDAVGRVYNQNGIVPFARGGIVNKPTLFPFANGIGLMGEAGAEAIMPLRRGPSGKLGVEATGAMGGNVVVNVDASGSSVEGDSRGADQLGKVIGLAVQNELVKQKRPGGLLA